MEQQFGNILIVLNFLIGIVYMTTMLIRKKAPPIWVFILTQIGFVAILFLEIPYELVNGKKMYDFGLLLAYRGTYIITPLMSWVYYDMRKRQK